MTDYTERAREIWDKWWRPEGTSANMIADIAAALIAAERAGAEKGEYLAERWKQIAENRYTIDDLARHREEGERAGAEKMRALDEAQIRSAVMGVPTWEARADRTNVEAATDIAKAIVALAARDAALADEEGR